MHMAGPSKSQLLAHLTFYFDVSSPSSYLAFERLPEVLAGRSCSVTYHPVYLPQILKSSGLPRGPFEAVNAKNPDDADDHNLWLAKSQAPIFTWPARHPFESRPYLRLLKACTPVFGGAPSRWVVETALKHLWLQGLDPAEPETFLSLQAALAPQILPQFQSMADLSWAPELDHALEASNLKAIERGVRGVPAIQWGAQIFNGLDQLNALADALSQST
jgi:2-hydroxychromene-2-carboxylate isomerase